MDKDKMLSECESCITSLCSVFGVLGEYRQIIMLNVLCQWILVRSDEPTRANTINYSKIAMTKNASYNESVMKVMLARDNMIYAFGSDEQIASWEDVWDNGHVKEVLKYWDFI